MIIERRIAIREIPCILRSISNEEIWKPLIDNDNVTKEQNTGL